MQREHHLPDLQAMESLAGELARQFQYPEILYLQGDLGVGKTTLARYILESLGHQGAVKSPTYTLYESYQVAGREICHFDLYRLTDPIELDDIGFRDLLGADLLLIEWPERAITHLPVATMSIALSDAPAGEDGRCVMITTPD